MLFYFLSLFSCILDIVWLFSWIKIYGLQSFDENRNLINSSRSEIFFHNLVLLFMLIILILKIVFAIVAWMGDKDTKESLSREALSRNMRGFFRLGA